MTGGHQQLKDKPVLDYSRDALAEPICQLGCVLDWVFARVFRPEESRSGRWKSGIDRSVDKDEFMGARAHHAQSMDAQDKDPLYDGWAERFEMAIQTAKEQTIKDNKEIAEWDRRIREPRPPTVSQCERSTPHDRYKNNKIANQPFRFGRTSWQERGVIPSC